ncbi:hypothetical protein TNCV_1571781 [Trichonephila clavipes]|uniref:Uncharacterized protein n=1 Tax=Trichonephila clavipes TaxID=2585209 RepID=A0A8X6VED9_TRICX|nr:hypothetical protein TNCV_1571781 [Trichonephila clavipes]
MFPGSGDHGSLVVKIRTSGPACQKFEPRTAEDPPCRGAMHVKSAEAQTASRWEIAIVIAYGLVVKRVKCHLGGRFHLTAVQPKV